MTKHIIIMSFEDFLDKDCDSAEGIDLANM